MTCLAAAGQGNVYIVQVRFTAHTFTKAVPVWSVTHYGTRFMARQRPLSEYTPAARCGEIYGRAHLKDKNFLQIRYQLLSPAPDIALTLAPQSESESGTYRRGNSCAARPLIGLYSKTICSQPDVNPQCPRSLSRSMRRTNHHETR